MAFFDALMVWVGFAIIGPKYAVLLSILSGKLFGVHRVILGIPAYAVMKVIFEHLFKWHQSYSGLYEQDYTPVTNLVGFDGKSEIADFCI